MKEFAGIDMNGNKVFWTSGLSMTVFCERHNIKMAVCFRKSGSTCCQMDTGINMWNGKDHGIAEGYTADARIGRTPIMCFDKIKAEGVEIN